MRAQEFTNKLEHVFREAQRTSSNAGLEGFLLLKSMLFSENQNDPTISDKILKKVRFIGFELENKGINFLNTKDQITKLSESVYRHIKADEFTIGCSLLSLAANNGITMRFVRIGKKLVLKSHSEDGDYQYVSLSDEGRLLDIQEILDAINEESTFESLDFKEIILAYIESLRYRHDLQLCKRSLLRMCDVILMLKTSDPVALLHRAYLLKELGLSREALMDLKRYMSFQPPHTLTTSLRKLYHQLSRKASEGDC
jgi:hypothetical protein